MEMASLVGQIYDCVDDEDQWEGVLESLFKAFDCSAASFQAQSWLNRPIECTFPLGVFEDAFKVYCAEWMNIDTARDALIKRIMQTPPHLRTDPFTFDTIFLGQAFRKSEIYAEFYSKSELTDQLALPFDFTGQFCGIGLWRGKGSFSDEQIHTAKFVSPHIVRAKSLANQLRYSNMFIKKNGDLNAISEPVFLIGQEQNLLGANHAAGILLEKGETVLLKNKTLKFRDGVADRRLAEAVRNMAKLAPARNRQTQFSMHDGTTITLSELIVPLKVKRFSTLQREFILTIAYPKLRKQSITPAAGRRFGFTKTEQEIAAMLTQGMPVRAISERRRTKISTTRWHIKQLFAKTGVANQRELLMKLLVQ